MQYEATADDAWELYCRKGVVMPGFAGEIANRRAVKRQWDEAGEPLR